MRVGGTSSSSSPLSSFSAARASLLSLCAFARAAPLEREHSLEPAAAHSATERRRARRRLALALPARASRWHRQRERSARAASVARCSLTGESGSAQLRIGPQREQGAVGLAQEASRRATSARCAAARAALARGMQHRRERGDGLTCVASRNESESRQGDEHSPEPRISLTPLDDADDALALSKAPSRSHEQPVLFIALTLHIPTLVLLPRGATAGVQGRLGLERVLQRLVDLDLDLGLGLLLLGARAAGDALRLGEAGADGLRVGEREERGGGGEGQGVEGEERVSEAVGTSREGEGRTSGEKASSGSVRGGSRGKSDPVIRKETARAGSRARAAVKLGGRPTYMPRRR